MTVHVKKAGHFAPGSSRRSREQAQIGARLRELGRASLPSAFTPAGGRGAWRRCPGESLPETETTPDELPAPPSPGLERSPRGQAGHVFRLGRERAPCLDFVDGIYVVTPAAVAVPAGCEGDPAEERLRVLETLKGPQLRSLVAPSWGWGHKPHGTDRLLVHLRQGRVDGGGCFSCGPVRCSASPDHPSGATPDPADLARLRERLAADAPAEDGALTRLGPPAW